MKKDLLPHWSKQDRLKGKRLQRAWEHFFSGKQPAGKSKAPALSDRSAEQRLSGVFAKHEATLLGYPHVIGVATGIRTRRGKPTGEQCLIVYVSRKIPPSKLRASEALPREIDGVPIDVVEVGTIEPLAL